LLVAWTDYGFVATDEHNHVLVDAVPAQALGDSLEVYPSAYSERAPTPVHRVNFLPVRAAREAGCSVAIAVRDDLVMGESFELEGLRQVAVFEPGVLERILTVTNPARNHRRSALRLYLPNEC